MTVSMRWLADAASHSAGYAASTLIRFALLPVMLRGLSGADYGIWIVSLSASAALGTVTMALWWVIIREMAAAPDDDEPLRALVADAFLTTLLVAGVGGLLLSIAGASGLISQGPSSEQHSVLRLTGVVFFWEQVAACAAAVLAGQRRFAPLNAITVATDALRAASIVLILLHGGGLITVVACHIAFTAMGALALASIMFAGAPWLRTLRPVAPFSALRRRLRFGSQIQLATVVTSGTMQLVPLVVSRVFGSAAVVPLYIGVRLPLAASSLVHRIAETAYPVLVRISVNDGVDAVRRQVNLATRWVLAFAIPVSLTLWLAAPIILRLWLGAYPPETLVIFRLAALAVLFEVAGLPFDYALVSAGRSGSLLVGAVGCAIAQVGVLAWLLRSQGVVAAGYALLASCVVGAVLYFAAADRLGFVRRVETRT